MSDTPLAAAQLFKSINLCHWQVVMQQIQADPSLAKLTDDASGLYPLHAICAASRFSAPPLRIIKMLLAANPAAAQIKSGQDDRLPIHYLLAGAITEGGAPSEAIVSALIELYPGGARVPDANNQLPIHLACQATAVSDKVLTFILSTYPEGAYARDFYGKYPLDYATSNKDITTKKVALAALDRGTLYASISKMTTQRLSQENESKARSIEEVYEKKLSKMECHAKEERAKLKVQLDGMLKQLKEEKETNQALREEKELILIEKDQAVAQAIRFERDRSTKLEEELRSDLADVQLKNMDMLDQLESTQCNLDISKETEEKLVGEIETLKVKSFETNKTLEHMKNELDMTQEKVKVVQDNFVAALNVIEEKSARIYHLEQSLRAAKSSVLHLIEEHERMQENMEKQKETLGVFISQQIGAEKDSKTSLLKMSLLVDAISVAEQATVDVPIKTTVKEVVKGERSELADESQ